MIISEQSPMKNTFSHPFALNYSLVSSIGPFSMHIDQSQLLSVTHKTKGRYYLSSLQLKHTWSEEGQTRQMCFKIAIE